MELFGGGDKRMKRCSRCGAYKSLTEFNQHTNTPILHRQPYCRQCQKEYAREHSAYSPRATATERVGETQRTAYNELYARYKAFRLSLETYRTNFKDSPEERLSFEFDLGL